MADTPNKEDELRDKLEGSDNELYGTDAWRNEDKQMYVFANNPEAHRMLHTFRQLIREKGEDEGLIAIVNGIQTRENPLKEDLKVVGEEDEKMRQEVSDFQNRALGILTLRDSETYTQDEATRYWQEDINGLMSYLKSRDQRIALEARKPVVVEINTKDVCDYCNEAMKYAGSNDGVVIVRSCADHLKHAEQRLASLKQSQKEE